MSRFQETSMQPTNMQKSTGAPGAESSHRRGIRSRFNRSDDTVPTTLVSSDEIYTTTSTDNKSNNTTNSNNNERTMSVKDFPQEQDQSKCLQKQLISDVGLILQRIGDELALSYHRHGPRLGPEHEGVCRGR